MDKGVMETKPIQLIIKHIKAMLINNILPKIREKWPTHMSKTIYIQYDKAKPHITNLDTEFRNVATLGGFDFHLV